MRICFMKSQKDKYYIFLNMVLNIHKTLIKLIFRENKEMVLLISLYVKLEAEPWHLWIL